MKYNFKKHDWDGTIVFGIESEQSTINNIGSWDWTSEKIQKIIKGIEESKTKPKGEEYLWGNEDVNLYANENGALLIDVMAQRAKQYDPDIITLRLTHEEILTFLNDFKKFVEENS